jgi:pyruvate dehydrogenase E2 component (dihydrolipoamide acetyltransferase)
MDLEFKMPDLATTDSAIKVIRWLVEVGQPVTRGQALLEVETDKATMEVECIATGRLKEKRAQAGDALSAGQLLAVIESAGGPAAPVAPSATATPPAAAVAASQPAPAAKTAGGMFAKNRAAAAPSPAPAGRPPIALSPAQATAARRLQQSKQTIPHFYLQTSANAEPLLKCRAGSAGQNIAWDAFFVHAAGNALKKFPRLACRYEADRLVPAGTDAIGVAVDHADELFVLAIANPAAKTPGQISDELRTLVTRLRAGDPETRRLRPATLTITNLGGTGVETFAAIVNPPEAAILAIGKAALVPAVVDGKVVAQTRLSLTLSADHRIVSGKYAAQFLDEIVRELEAL